MFFLMAAAAIKCDAQSMLRVSLRDNTQISVSVDERHFRKHGTSVTVGELPYGGHSLKIYAYLYDRWGRRTESLIYSGRITTYNGMVSVLVFDPRNGSREIKEVDIDEYMASHPSSNTGRMGGVPGDYDSRFSKGQDMNDPYGARRNSGQEPYNDVRDNGVTNSNSNDNGLSSTPAASPVSQEKIGTMTGEKMNGLKTKVSAKTTDTQKLALLKEELKDEKLNTDDIADMMDWFSFEASKVEFAKWAYPQVVDKEYYGDLDGKFSYKSSQDDFNNFLKDHK